MIAMSKEQDGTSRKQKLHEVSALQKKWSGHSYGEFLAIK